MDLAQMLRELWRHKFWLLVGALVAAAVGVNTAYDVDVRSLSLKQKGLEFGAASTEVLVDSKSSALAKTTTNASPQAEPFDALSRRADVYAQLLASPPLKRAIAREAGLGRRAKIAARPPTDAPPEGEEGQPSEERANQLLNESTGQRLFFDRKDSVPVIKVYGEAPTKEEALKLVAGVAPALSKYIARVQRQSPAPPARETKISQLGDPRGGTVNSGASKTAALLAFLGVFIVACIVILVVSTLARDWRRAAALERGELVWEPARYGDRTPPFTPVPREPDRTHTSLELSRVRRSHRG
jgi:hypothetical protein